MRRLKNPHLKNRLSVTPAKKEYDDQGLEIFIQKADSSYNPYYKLPFGFYYTDKDESTAQRKNISQY